MAQQNLVDVARRDAGVGQRFARDSYDQALDGLAFEPAKCRVGPSDDASGHGCFPAMNAIQAGCAGIATD